MRYETINMNKTPLIVTSIRHCLQDGPAPRRVVFFKGCPLRCVFSQNPETQEQHPEIAFSIADCIKCGNCLNACPSEAISFKLKGRINRQKCTLCGKCVDACPGNALKLIGSYYPVETLADYLLKDLSFYRHSGGGVTLSGGECTLYPEYLYLLLKKLKSKDVNIAVQTSGYFQYESFRKMILPFVDLIYFDVKFALPEAHKKYTGKSNKRILSNLRKLLKEDASKIYPRTPIIPGITTDKENISAIIDILCSAGAKTVSLLPYNPMGIGKQLRLGKTVPALPKKFMKPSQERKLLNMVHKLLEQKRIEIYDD